MSKSILIVGVLDVPGSTNIYMKKGFEALGYDVHEYNYRTIMNEIGMENMWQDLIDWTEDQKFDLIVFCKTNQIHPQTLDAIKRSGPTWYWFMDNMEVAKGINASTYAQNATFASATASNVAERFKSINNNAHHIFEGYDPSVYYYEDLPKIHDAIFIGNATIPRIQTINELKRKGLNVVIFGQGWPIGMDANAPVYAEDERIEICQSHMVLNLCHDNIIFSDRVIKSLACGANVVSHVCEDLLDFIIDLPLVKYSMEDPGDIADFEWVAFSNGSYDVKCPGFPEHCETLKPANYFHEFVKSNYSWEAVCAKIMKKVEDYNACTIR